MVAGRVSRVSHHSLHQRFHCRQHRCVQSRRLLDRHRPYVAEAAAREVREAQVDCGVGMVDEVVTVVIQGGLVVAAVMARREASTAVGWADSSSTGCAQIPGLHA